MLLPLLIAVATGKKIIKAHEAVEERTQNTQVTTAEKVGYRLSPVMTGAISLIQGNSPQEIGDKFIRTHVDGVNGVKKVVQDAQDGPFPKWLTYVAPATGIVNLVD